MINVFIKKIKKTKQKAGALCHSKRCPLLPHALARRLTILSKTLEDLVARISWFWVIGVAEKNEVNDKRQRKKGRVDNNSSNPVLCSCPRNKTPRNLWRFIGRVRIQSAQLQLKGSPTKGTLCAVEKEPPGAPKRMSMNWWLSESSEVSGMFPIASQGRWLPVGAAPGLGSC